MSTRQRIKFLGTIVFVFTLIVAGYGHSEEKGLIGCWKFDEGKGDIANDFSGMLNDGTIHGAGWVKGVSGFALQFDGIDDYVDCGDDTSMEITDAITVEAWVKPAAEKGSYEIISKQLALYHRLTIRGNKLAVELGFSGTYPRYESAGTIGPANMWHHIAYTYKNADNKICLYTDGKLDVCRDTPGSIPGISGERLCIGAFMGRYTYFNGLIDEVRIYNRALSPEEIQSHYENLKPRENPAEANSRIEMVARKDYNLSSYWTLKKTLGKDFWFLLPPINNQGVKEEEFIKEVGYVISSSRAFPMPFVLSRICLREIEVFDTQGRNISSQATFSFSSPPKWYYTERLNDQDTSPLKTTYSSKPKKAAFKNIYLDLDFLKEKEIKKIILYQGIKKPSSSKVSCLLNHFVFQSWQNSKWEDIRETEVKANKSDIVKLTFLPVKTKKLRLLIHDGGRESRLPYKMSSLSPYLDRFIKERPFYLMAPGRYERGIYIPSGHITYGDFLKLGGKNYFLDHKDYKRWKEKYKEHFLGFRFDEWGLDIRNVFWWKVYPDPFGITLSNNKKDNCEILEKRYKLFKSAHFDDVFGLNCTFPWDHYNLEWGGNMAAIETTGYGNRSWQLQISFARGAARQYSKPWMMYQAYYGWEGFPVSSGGNIYSRGKHAITGPLAGIPISLARRGAYLSYMSGANFFTAESYPGAHIQDYDKDGIYRLTKQGETLKEIFEFSQRYPERGVSYTPVAFLLDYHHGWSPSGASIFPPKKAIWYNLPYQKGDFMIEKVMDIFPPGKLSNIRYGDIFDILIPNPPSGTISQKLLSTYKVLIPLGDIEIDKDLAEKLIAYVRDGGTLILNTSQVDNGLFSEKFLGVRLGKEIKRGENFDYLPVETLTAKDLFVENEGRVLAAINKFGEGNLILTIPSYCLDKENKLLPFFSQILSRLTKETLPFRIEGDIGYLINKNERGEWLITLLNNKGIKKKIPMPANKNSWIPPENFNPETFDPAKTALVSIYPNIPGSFKRAVELITEKEIPLEEIHGGKGIRTKVFPGDVQIIRIEME